jgi:hypothetical protein
MGLWKKLKITLGLVAVFAAVTAVTSEEARATLDKLLGTYDQALRQRTIKGAIDEITKLNLVADTTAYLQAIGADNTTIGIQTRAMMIGLLD